MEGTKLQVEKVYASLKDDPRHIHLTVLKEGLIEDRAFSSWNMGYKAFNLQQYPDLELFFKMDTQSLVSNDDDHPMLGFLKSFSAAGKNLR